jgi:hypothetical protein
MGMVSNITPTVNAPPSEEEHSWSFISRFSRPRTLRQRDACCEIDPVPISGRAPSPRWVFSKAETESWVTWSSSVETDSSVVSRWKAVSGKEQNDTYEQNAKCNNKDPKTTPPGQIDDNIATDDWSDVDREYDSKVPKINAEASLMYEKEIVDGCSSC